MCEVILSDWRCFGRFFLGEVGLKCKRDISLEKLITGLSVLSGTVCGFDGVVKCVRNGAVMEIEGDFGT